MELVVVIAILALAAAIVLPRLQVSRSAELSRSARQLAATIRFLQDRAITTKTTYRMRLELGGNAISVTRTLPDGSEETPDDQLLRRPFLADGITVASVITPRGGKRQAGEAVIPFGVAGLGEFTMIHLRNGDDAMMTVLAYPSSGTVTVAEGYREEAP